MDNPLPANQPHRQGTRRTACRAGIAVTAISLTLVAACSTKVGSPGSSNATATAASTSSAAPNTSYFKGKTITYDVPAAPGTSSYLSAQILAPVVGKILGATVNLVSIPAGNGIAGQNQVNSSQPNGLTLGTLNVNTDLQSVIQQQSGVNFDITKTTIIAGELRSPSLIVSAPGSPYKTFADAIDSKSTFTAIDDSGGSDEQLRVLFGAYQAKAHLLSGYSDAGSVVQGFLRGDGPITQQSFSDLQGAIDGGKAVPLLLNASYPAGAPDYDKLKNVPTVQSFLDEHKPATADGQKAVQALADQFTNTSPNQVVFAAPGTPADVAAALQQAFKQALNESSVQTAFNKAGLTPGYIDPAATLAHIKDVIAGAPAIRTYLDYSYSGS